MKNLGALENLPETERLAAVFRLVRQVQTDSEAVARVLLRYSAPSQQELQDRWRPVLDEAVDQVAAAAEVLAEAATRLREIRPGTPVAWAKGKPQAGWLHALVKTAGALTGLLVRLQAYEIEGRSVDQLNTMRMRSLLTLPPTVRAQLLAERDGDA